MQIEITPRQIAHVVGKSESYGYKYYHLLKDVYGKAKHQGITIKEFCEYRGLNEYEVRASLAMLRKPHKLIAHEKQLEIFTQNMK